ncbi:MAG: hypothetical protein OXT67_04815, partial [Zetaproteobacteria bacterium]|nr:hypothetical protein [Zetaproteobacteria bacterium]
SPTYLLSLCTGLLVSCSMAFAQPTLTVQKGKLDSSYFDLLPEDVLPKILVPVMKSYPEPQKAESLAAIHPDFQQIFDEHCVEIDPYKYVLQANQDVWLAQVRQNGGEVGHPSYLSAVLQVENELFTRVVQSKESALQTADDWKRHAQSILAAWDAVRTAIHMGSWCYVLYDLEDSPTDKAHSALLRAAQSTLGAGLQRCVREAVNRTVRESKWYHFYDKVADILRLYAQQPIEQQQRALYRMSELVTWIQALNPEEGAFAHAYDQAYTTLKQENVMDTSEWFVSAQHLHDKITADLGQHAFDSVYLAGLVSQLRQVAVKWSTLEQEAI